MACEDTLKVVMAAVREVFQQQVSADQNFFDLNGNSQQAVSLVLRIEESLGRAIDFPVLLDANSFSEFSILIDEARLQERRGPFAGCPTGPAP